MNPTIFLSLLRELASTYQAFEIYSSAHIRSMDLTPAQFDIIATLGNTPGMSPKELGEHTLITKGTMTGVVDRLVDKGLVRRSASPTDGRCQVIQLTAAGDRLFARIFPAHLEYMQRVFEQLSQEELASITASLEHLRRAFINAIENQEA